MKNTFLITAVLFSFSSFANVCQTLESCQEEATKQSFSYLPQYLQDKKVLCEIYNTVECFEKAVDEANEVLLCAASKEREKEMAEIDSEAFKGFHKEYGSAEVPRHVQDLFQELLKGAERVSSEQFPWKFSAYNAPFINAHAGADAQVMASAALWKEGTAFHRDEMAAILAHEVGHILKHHSLQLGCLALEWTGATLSLKNAMEAFREDFSTATERGQVWSKKSNAIEFEADAMATEILYQAGFDPLAMGRALEKLRPKDGGGFSSGSHPEFDVRIETANKEAKKTLRRHH